jgi:hypothetical protein
MLRVSCYFSEIQMMRILIWCTHESAGSAGWGGVFTVLSLWCYILSIVLACWILFFE